jgi:hypothetical protein
MKIRLSCLFIALLSFNALVFSQKKMDVSLKISYKGNALCNWEVTLKHGDVALGKAITDDNGFAKFPNVTVLSKNVDAYGHKKSANGEKKWDVKGYIELNDAGHADFDFEPLVKEMGMPAMIENAWGLTIKDCGQSSANSSKKEEATSTTSTAEKEVRPTETSTTSESPSLADNNKVMKENLEVKIQLLTNKLDKKEKEKAKYSEGSKEYSDVMYDIEDLKLEKQLTQLQLEKTEKSIARNNLPLKKEERDFYNEKEKEIKGAQKIMKENKKAGLLFGQKSTVAPAKNNEKSSKSNKGNKENKESKLKLNSIEEINDMSTAQLKKLKVELNSQLTSRKMKQKTNSKKFTDEEKNQIDLEIKSIDAQLELINQVLSTRKDQ